MINYVSTSNIISVPCDDITIPLFRSRLNIKPYEPLQKYLLMDTLKLVGLINYIHVRKSISVPDKYEIIDGLERLEAVKRLGWGFIPAKDHGYITDDEAIKLYKEIEIQQY